MDKSSGVLIDGRASPFSFDAEESFLRGPANAVINLPTDSEILTTLQLQAEITGLKSRNASMHDQLSKVTDLRADYQGRDREMRDSLRLAAEREELLSKDCESANTCAIFWKKQADDMVRGNIIVFPSPLRGFDARIRMQWRLS